MPGFGSNYYPVEEEQWETLENGDYTARIVKAEMKNYSNGNEFCELTVQIKDHPKCSPNRIVLNSAPVLGSYKANGQQVTEEDVKRGNAKITRFFKSFGIQDGNFNIVSWKGHVGTVHCAEQYDKNEPDNKSKKYKELTPVVREKPSTPVPSAVQTIAKAMGGEVQNEFSEDIPF